jgi:WD40 repeat protein
MAARNTRPNPYVGPRAFQTGEKLYGRDLESRQLLDLLKSERIVLLHSPSGAGKSSLIYADLIPNLGADGFEVLPVARVNLEPPDGMPQGPNLNRYVLSLLVSLEEGRPRDECRSPEQLADLSLSEYLAEAKVRDHAADDADVLLGERVLIIDQFEEILTVDPADREGKRAFFRQLGTALYDDRRLWALFAIREDYMPALDPYLRPIPTRLSNTYRLDLLGADAARQAIQRPTGEAGVAFDGSTAQLLVDDLRRIRIQQPDGAVVERLGPYVEPLQLQVVCYRLWESLSPEDTVIDQEDLVAMGDVDRSLEEYYAERVAVAATEADVPERAIREWFNRHLITESGLRGQVLMGAEETGGLENRLIGTLRDAYLVRTEQRGGRTWCELTHDRMVGPVRRNNAVWLQAHLNLVQRQAAAWVQQGRPRGMLLRGDELADGQRWAQAHAGELTQEEEEFIQASQDAEERERRERELREQQLRAAQKLAEEQSARAQEQQRFARRLLWMVAVLAVVFVLAVGAAIAAVLQTRQVTRRRQIALANSLVAAASSTDNDNELTALLAVQASQVSAGTKEPVGKLIDDALRDVLSQPYFNNTLRDHWNDVTSVAFSPDGRWLASGSRDTMVRLWNMNSPAAEVRVLKSHQAGVWSVAFSPDGRWLASGGDDWTVRLWDIGDLSSAPHVLSGHGDAITSVAFSPDGRWLASASTDRTVRLWDVANPSAAPRVLDGHQDVVWSVAISSDGRWLASGSGAKDRKIRVWRLQALLDGESIDPSAEFDDHGSAVLDMAFGPDGRWLASGGEDHSVRLHDMENPQDLSRLLDTHQDRVLSVAFSPGGRRLASSGQDQTIRIWDISGIAGGGQAVETEVLHGHEFLVWSVAFGPDGRWLASGSADRTARIWDTEPTAASVRVLSESDGAATRLAFGSGGPRLASGGLDHKVRLWDLSGLSEGGPVVEARELGGHEDWVWSLAFSPDGRWLASGSEDKTVRLWDTQNPSRASHVLDGHGGLVWSVAFSPDGRWLASGSADTKVRLWDTQDLSKAPHVLDNHIKGVSSVSFGPDGRWLASTSEDETVRLWDISGLDRDEGPVEAYVLRDHAGRVLSVAFSPDGRWLASGGWDKTVRLWKLSDPTRKARVLAGHQGDVNFVAFSPDGRWLASASQDKTVRLWDLDDLSIGARVLTGHTDTVWSVVFSPDGQQAASSSKDGTIRLWVIPREDLVEMACARVRRNLSGGEWDQYLPGEPYVATCPNLSYHQSAIEALIHQGEIRKARASLEQAIRLDPTLNLVPEAEVARAEAEALVDEDDIETALKAFERAVQADPSLGPDIARRLVEIGQDSGDLWYDNETLIAFALATELDPGLRDEVVRRLIRIGREHAEEGGDVEALILFQRAIEVATELDDPFLIGHLCWNAPRAQLAPRVYAPICTRLDGMTYPIRLANVSINGGSDTAVVSPGDSFTVTMDYRITDALCPDCVNSIVVGYGSEPDRTRGCIYMGIPGPEGAQGSAQIVIEAPATPGTYPLGFDRARRYYYCRTRWLNGPPDASRRFATIEVK